jgi:CubicO group peptidase (beta-lactamase class C family)
MALVKFAKRRRLTMLKKIFRLGTAFGIVLMLLFSPFTQAYAQATGVTGLITTLDTKVNYDDTVALAKKKAAFLTSIYGSTSVQYALIDNGEIILSDQAGVNDKREKTVPTEEDMYGIGSISKIFTSVAVMQLVDQGKVDLDTSIVQYIPEFKMADKRYKDITARMLLNHSSGLFGSTFNSTILFNDNDSSTYNNLLNRLSVSRLKADPGAFSVYCNDGFSVAQILVERVTGISFSEYINENINQPLGLRLTKTPNDNFDRNQLVKAYQVGSDSALPTENLNAIGAGGIYSTAEEICKFAEIFMTEETNKVLSIDSVKALMNPEYLNGIWPKGEAGSVSYGLGWDSVDTYPFNQYGIKALVKGGDTLQYHGSMIVLPDYNMAMVVLSTGGASIYNQAMAQEVLLSALKARENIDEIKPYKTFTKPIKANMPSKMTKYEGFYAYYNGISKVAISKDGTLTLSNAIVKNSLSQKFTYTGDGKFYSYDGSTCLNFITETNGLTYLNVSGYSMLHGISQIPNSIYQGQKLVNNPITVEVLAAWKNRDNKLYFVINEKYDSAVYSLSPISKLYILKDLEGYCGYTKIIDKNNAKADIQIPGVNGRDLSDYFFYKVGNTEYLKSNASLLISEDNVKTLSSKSSFTVKIGKEGFAKWYKINQTSEKKEISVNLPKEASFSVYDENGILLNNSIMDKKSTVTLPAKGYIVFTGNKDAEFAIKFVK